MKIVFVFLSLLLALTPAAWGHASLLETAPPSGAVLAQAPQSITLTFNEPVGVTVMRLVGPHGKPLQVGPVADRDKQIRITVPASHVRGTYLLSWRIVSADGHPVGGTLAYSVGAASVHGAPQASADTARLAAIWLTRWLTFLCLFAGVGAALFRSMKGAAPQPWAHPVVVAGWVLLALDLGLQGLDLLGAPWRALLQPDTWAAAVDGSYGWTVGLMALALLSADAALRAPSAARRRVGAALALILSGAAVAASGHAGTAPPEWLSRPLVAVHAVLAIAWIGTLVPLMRLAHRRSAQPGHLAPLASFTRWIVPVVVLLVASGLGLALLQLDHVSDLWRTAYGRVLTAKVLCVVVLLGFAAFNRWRNTRPALAGNETAQKRLARTTRIEALLAIVILGIVALWRLTPPPRSLEARPVAAMPTFHLQNDRARAEIKEQGTPGSWTIALTQPGGQPFPTKQVTLTLDNPAAGIEALRSTARQQAPGHWVATLPPLPPIAGWHAQVTVLVNDFEEFTLQDMPSGVTSAVNPTAMPGTHGHAMSADHAAAPSLQDIEQTPESKILSVSDCWIRLLPNPAPSAAYFIIRNSGTQTGTLQAAASPAFASVMLHQTTEQNGISSMAMSDQVTVPAGGQLAFKPGGYHVMLEKPTRTLAVGGTVKLAFLTGTHEHVTASCQLEPPTTTRQ